MQVSEDGSMAFLPATRFVGPVVDDWVRVSARGVKCDFTHGHTMPYLEQKTYRWRTCKAGDMIGGQRHYHIPLAGEWGGYEAGSDAHARVLCAAQADGYWGPKGLQFTLKKSRKVERLRALLDAAEVSYREYVCAAYPDRTEFHIHQRGRPEWLTPDRKVFGAWCLNYNPRAIIDELVHWDGTPHPDGGVKYCSHDPDNLAWVRTLGALCGRKVGLSRSTCHISDARPICTVKTRTHVSTVTNSRRAYCATTQTGYWLARSRGTVFVTGNTGRMTYASSQGRGKAQVPTGIALHQWKRDPEFRSTITPPEGYTLCEFDFAGQEFRWMAVMSRDTTMLNLCFPGEDAHAYMGASIRSINYKALMQKVADGDKEAKGIRQLGKVANLSLQYRTSPPRLRDMARVQFGIDLDPILAKNIHTTYRSTYPGVVRYWKAQANFVKNHSYIVNLIGRRVHLLPPAFRDYEYTWSYEVSAVNFPIQSIGADQKYLALSIMRDELPRWRAYFYYELHDGLFFIVPDELAELFVVHSKHLLSNLPYEKAWGQRLPIPFPVDAKLGKSWGALKEYHG